MTPTIRLGSVAEIVASVPFLLGFTPRDSIVTIALRDMRVLFTARVDNDQVQAAQARMPGALAMNEATSVIVLVYADTREAAEEVLNQYTLGFPVAIADSAVVADGRYWDMDPCDCEQCPPNGSLINVARDAPGPLELSTIATSANSRDDIVAACQQQPFLASLVLNEMAQLASRPDDITPERVESALAAVLGFDTCTIEDKALLMLSAGKPDLRDLVYAVMAPGVVTEETLASNEAYRLRAAGMAAGFLDEDGRFVDRDAYQRSLTSLRGWARDAFDQVPDLAEGALIVATVVHYFSGDAVSTRAFAERVIALPGANPPVIDSIITALQQGIDPTSVGGMSPYSEVAS